MANICPKCWGAVDICPQCWKAVDCGPALNPDYLILRCLHCGWTDRRLRSPLSRAIRRIDESSPIIAELFRKKE